MSPPWGRRLAQVAIGLLLIGLLLRRADLSRVVETLLSADPKACAAGFACLVAATGVEVSRLTRMYARYPISVSAAVHLHLTGAFFNNFLPGSVGGELYRLHLLHQLENDLARPLGLLVLLRFSGLAVLATMALLYGATSFARLERELSASLGARPHAPSPVWLAVALLAALLLLATPPGRRLAGRLRGPLLRALSAAREVPARTLAAVSLLSAGIWLLRAGSLHFFVGAFVAAPRFGDLFLVIAAANLLGHLPVSIGGLGVREGALAAGLTALGVPLPGAVAVALLSRASLWVVSLLGGILYLVRGRIGREELLG